MTESPIKSILCCTSYSALAEPRAPKFVAALSTMFPDAKIVFIDAAPSADKDGPPCTPGDTGAVNRKTCGYPTKSSGIGSLILAKGAQWLQRAFYRLGGRWNVRSISIITPYLGRKVADEDFDLIVGHNIDTLPVVCDAGQTRGAKIVFDCMEFYSDMGEGQSDLARRVVRDMEASCLPRCDLVLASSREVAEALERQYGLESVVPVYNAAPVATRLPPKLDDGRFHLYWRNSTVGMSQRGLGDALEALPRLSDDVVLNVQGRPGSRMSAVRERVSALGLQNRVVFHDAYEFGDAVLSASPYSVGLCPERDTCLNQRLTVSNKIFDYLMAGLAVVCSNLPGLASVVSDSRAGLVHQAGDVRALAETIQRLYEDRDMLVALQNNARRYSITQVNESSELGRFSQAIWRLAVQE